MEFRDIPIEKGTDEVYVPKSVGIIGMGRIGEALLTGLVNSSEGLGIENVLIGYRQKEKEKISGLIAQNLTLGSVVRIGMYDNIYELGKSSDIIVIVIGKKESVKNQREDLTGIYFHDIKVIMEGLKDSKSTILMVTNPVTPNCLVADLYSQQEMPNIIGFTRIDYIRARHLLIEQIKKDGNKGLSDEHVEVDVLGPHGKGLLVTNIRIGEKGKRTSIYNNLELNSFFNNYDNFIENLSESTSEYGESIYKQTKGTPAFSANQIIGTLSLIIKGGKDTAAIDINLEKICKSGLNLPKGPVYASVPVIYKNGRPQISEDLEINRIPLHYRKKLLNTLLAEEERIKKYLIDHRNGFSLLRDHFDIESLL